MSLRRKMGLQIGAMIGGLLLACIAALWGLNAVHEDFGVAIAGYQELRQVYEVGAHLAIAKSLLSPGLVDRSRALLQVQSAAMRFDLLTTSPSAQRGAALANFDKTSEARVRDALRSAVVQLRKPAETRTDEDSLDADSSAISVAMGRIGDLAASIRENVIAHQQSARKKHQATTLVVAVISAIVILGTALLGIAQYRSVMLPLAGLRMGVRKIAGGQFTQRLAPRGGEEFADLAAEFNRMAAELDGFYHQLEQKVAQQSKELIRSERLASVGFLAAGVAHEINNPLGIISGYAESSIEQLKAKNAHEFEANNCNSKEIIQSLRIICEEAFRCKDITTKLLSLARQGDESRQVISLTKVAQDVVAMLGGLPEYRDRRIVVHSDESPGTRATSIIAVEAEMKQVILNLVLNALEASAANRGEVRIEIHRRGEINDGATGDHDMAGTVELSVIDKGRGMAPDTLERVFEPFFTDKRGASDGRRVPGTGLGLSITHAIVQSHGGSIAAYSEGLGQASRFVMTLPACKSDQEARR